MNCFNIVSCLRVLSSPRIWVFFANPDRSYQKIKKFQIVLCPLKIVLIFQLDTQDICQIQHNFKTLQEANKFIKNYEVETFSKFPIFQEDVRFQNKSLCNTRCLSFCYMLFSKKLKSSAEKKYNYRWSVLRCFFIVAEKIDAP